MEEITSYKAKDGEIFNLRHECEEHEAKIRLREILHHINLGKAWDSEMVFKLLMDNANEVRELLSFLS